MEERPWVSDARAKEIEANRTNPDVHQQAYLYMDADGKAQVMIEIHKEAADGSLDVEIGDAYIGTIHSSDPVVRENKLARARLEAEGMQANWDKYQDKRRLKEETKAKEEAEARAKEKAAADAYTRSRDPRSRDPRDPRSDTPVESAFGNGTALLKHRKARQLEKDAEAARQAARGTSPTFDAEPVDDSRASAVHNLKQLFEETGFTLEDIRTRFKPKPANLKTLQEWDLQDQSAETASSLQIPDLLRPLFDNDIANPAEHSIIQPPAERRAFDIPAAAPLSQPFNNHTQPPSLRSEAPTTISLCPLTDLLINDDFVRYARHWGQQSTHQYLGSLIDDDDDDDDEDDSQLVEMSGSKKGRRGKNRPVNLGMRRSERSAHIEPEFVGLGESEELQAGQKMTAESSQDSSFGQQIDPVGTSGDPNSNTAALDDNKNKTPLPTLPARYQTVSDDASSLTPAVFCRGSWVELGSQTILFTHPDTMAVIFCTRDERIERYIRFKELCEGIEAAGDASLCEDGQTDKPKSGLASRRPFRSATATLRNNGSSATIADEPTASPSAANPNPGAPKLPTRLPRRVAAINAEAALKGKGHATPPTSSPWSSSSTVSGSPSSPDLTTRPTTCGFAPDGKWIEPEVVDDPTMYPPSKSKLTKGEKAAIKKLYADHVGYDPHSADNVLRQTEMYKIRVARAMEAYDTSNVRGAVDEEEELRNGGAHQPAAGRVTITPAPGAEILAVCAEGGASDDKRQSVQDAKKEKLSQLKRFGKDFTLSTPVPSDLMDIVAKDPETRGKIPNMERLEKKKTFSELRKMHLEKTQREIKDRANKHAEEAQRLTSTSASCRAANDPFLSTDGAGSATLDGTSQDDASASAYIPQQSVDWLSRNRTPAVGSENAEDYPEPDTNPHSVVSDALDRRIGETMAAHKKRMAVIEAMKEDRTDEETRAMQETRAMYRKMEEDRQADPNFKQSRVEQLYPSARLSPSAPSYSEYMGYKTTPEPVHRPDSPTYMPPMRSQAEQLYPSARLSPSAPSYSEYMGYKTTPEPVHRPSSPAYMLPTPTVPASVSPRLRAIADHLVATLDDKAAAIEAQKSAHNNPTTATREQPARVPRDSGLRYPPHMHNPYTTTDPTQRFPAPTFNYDPAACAADAKFQADLLTAQNPNPSAADFAHARTVAQQHIAARDGRPRRTSFSAEEICNGDALAQMVDAGWDMIMEVTEPRAPGAPVPFWQAPASAAAQRPVPAAASGWQARTRGGLAFPAGMMNPGGVLPPPPPPLPRPGGEWVFVPHGFRSGPDQNGQQPPRNE